MSMLPVKSNRRSSVLDLFSDFTRGYDLFDVFRDDFSSMFDTGMYETDEGYVVEFEMPGFTKDDISVEIVNGVMNVSGQREMPKNGAGLSKIARRLTVGDLEVKSAIIENGILRVVFEKESDDVEERKLIEVDGE